MNPHIRNLEEKAIDAVLAMERAAAVLMAAGDTDTAANILIQAHALGEAERVCNLQRCIRMTDDELRDEFAVHGWAYDDTSPGTNISNAIAEHKRRRVDEAIRWNS